MKGALNGYGLKRVVRQIILQWFKYQAAIAARKVLTGPYTRRQVEEILQAYWRKYRKLRTEVPEMPTLGGSVAVNLAALSRAFYSELINRGQDEEGATQLFFDIAWKVYAKMGRFSWWLAGWSTRKRFGRLSKATQLFRTFPFNSPSYGWEDVEAGDKIVGFDCTKCPVAEYFQQHGLSTFCTKTWCALDFPLADLWHAELERTGSIAGGADKCDFRWVVHSREK